MNNSSSTGKKPRQGLLKFCSPTPYALENLQNHVLYCQHYEGFNDPFELWADLVEGVPDLETQRDRFIAAANAWGFNAEHLEEALEHSEDYFESVEGLHPPFEGLLDRVRMACFGSEDDNLLMWSHYADGLRGFCIVFDEDIIIEGRPEGYITNVAYLERPPLIDSFVYAVAQDQQQYHLMALHETQTRVSLGKKDEESLLEPYQQAADAAHAHMHVMWQGAFATKPLEWKYEKERRLIVYDHQTGKDAIFRSYPKEAVKQIIVGERMDPLFLERLTRIVEKSSMAYLLERRGAQMNDTLSY